MWGVFLSAQFGYHLPFVEQRRVIEMQLKLLEIVGRACRESAAFFFFFTLLSFFHVGLNPSDLSRIV